MQPWDNLAFEYTEALISAYDDLPLWSAPFGLLLLDTVRLGGVRAALDVGFGSGFPLTELADRLGPGARVCGIDPSAGAAQRARFKLTQRGLSHVQTTVGAAERMPYPDASFDLVVSNNGINNVTDPAAVLAECYRVSRPGAQLVITVNLPGTMQEFYDVFRALLVERGDDRALQRLEDHIAAKRKPLKVLLAQISDAAFSIRHVHELSFRLRYASGSAMLRNSFIRAGFFGPWTQIVAPAHIPEVFGELERRLNALAAACGELSLIVPMVCVDATRQ
jgi:arsenite methyltransferase